MVYLHRAPLEHSYDLCADNSSELNVDVFPSFNCPSLTFNELGRRWRKQFECFPPKITGNHSILGANHQRTHPVKLFSACESPTEQSYTENIILHS